MTPFRSSPRFAYGLAAAALVVAVVSGTLLYATLQVRYRRDINRMVFSRNWDLLDQVKREAGVRADSLRKALDNVSPGPDADKPYLVVSIADRRLWYKAGDTVFYTTSVAVGSGKTLVKRDGRDEYKFDTPRGRLTVLSKDAGPVWVPPDWHYLELAKTRNLGVIMLHRGQQVPAGNGAVITVDSNDVVTRYRDGRTVPFESAEGKEIVVDSSIIVPPYGTNQRKYRGTLGGHRLNLGDGYALHGTDDPKSVGQAVSHGCVRLRNEDIDYLYGIVPVGTPVYIY
jgi:hypothetical protein